MPQIEMDFKLPESDYNSLQQGPPKYQDIGFGIPKIISDWAKSNMPELMELFPLQKGYKVRGHLTDEWVAISIDSLSQNGIHSIGGQLDTNEIDEFSKLVASFDPDGADYLTNFLGQLGCHSIVSLTWDRIGSLTYPARTSSVIWEFGSPTLCFQKSAAEIKNEF